MWQKLAPNRFMLKCQLQLKALWLRIWRQDYQYQIGPFTLALPPEHALPRYQAQYPQYDQLLTLIAAELADGSRVIDIGANCGDSAAALLTGNPSLNLLCIEADPMFSQYLQQNLALMQQQCPQSNLTQVQALVGLNVNAVALVGQGGTRKAVRSSDPLAFEQIELLAASTLDQLWQKQQTPQISLLKIDVDGFDYDVLDSAEQLISTQLPILLFEYQCDHDEQQQGFARTLNWLSNQGYCHWVVFDNFGYQMFYTEDPQPIIQLQSYLCQQRSLPTAGPVAYFDVLATTSSQTNMIEQLLKRSGH
jgi:FkbM family methyltransferase